MHLCQTNQYSILTCTVLFSCITLKALLQCTLLVKHRVLLTEGIVMQEVVCDKITLYKDTRWEVHMTINNIVHCS